MVFQWRDAGAWICKHFCWWEREQKGFLRLKKNFLRQEKKKENLWTCGFICWQYQTCLRWVRQIYPVIWSHGQMSSSRRERRKIRHITEIVRICLLDSREIEIWAKDCNLVEIGYAIPWKSARISYILQIFAKKGVREWVEKDKVIPCAQKLR